MRVGTLMSFLASDSEAQSRSRLTTALALGLWCPFLSSLFLSCLFLWRLVLWRLFLWCLFAAPSYASYALPGAPYAGRCELCAAPPAASCDRCAGSDAVACHRCAAPDSVPRHRRVGPGAAPRLVSEPQRPMPLAPRPAFPCQTPRLLPKFQACFDARSFPLQFSYSCSSSLVV